MNERRILGKYELLRLIGGDEQRNTFNARDVSASREVIVHLLKTPPSSQIKSELVTLSESVFQNGDVRELIFAGECDGTFCIVTEARPECVDIRKWLEAQAALRSSGNSSDDLLRRARVWKIPEPSTTRSSNPSEFTSLFQAGAPEMEPSHGVRNQEAPSSADPGEFTRLFRAPSGPVLAPDIQSGPAADSVPNKVDSEPGDFTRRFQAVPVGSQWPMEALPQQSDSSNQKGAGSPDSAVPVVTQQPNEAATGIFATPSAVEAPPVEQQPSGPSDFTRVIAVRVPQPVAPVQPVQGPQAPTPEPSTAVPSAPVTARSYLPLILILNGLFVAAVLVILYFALKK